MPASRSVPLIWSVGWTHDPASPPTDWVRARLPGAVQLDWQREKGLPDPFFADHYKQYRWMEQVDWVYRTVLPGFNLEKGERFVLRVDGLDYHGEVRLNGRRFAGHRGMVTPLELDLTAEALPGDVLDLVCFRPPNTGDTVSGNHSEGNGSLKPPVSYGWDWHPRLIPIGVAGGVEASVFPACSLRSIEAPYRLREDLGEAEVVLEVDLRGDWDGHRLEWCLRSPDGCEGAKGEGLATSPRLRFPFTVSHPRLWWPQGEGKQDLYELSVHLRDSRGTEVGAARRRIGFRRTRLVMYEGAWDEPGTLPGSPPSPPFTLEVNGRRIFARGSNWVAPDPFPGRIEAETYRPLLELAREAHFNLLRSWGGAMVSKEPFFEMCDEMGLMVWQEFPLACNQYPETESFLEEVDAESRAIIRRVRAHPCLALWSGGNELFCAWSRMTMQHKAIRLLDRNCFELDRETPFIPTSPIAGVGHGDYRFRLPDGREVFQIFRHTRFTAYTEFGVPGPSPIEHLRTFIPEEELFPPRRGTAWQTHHGFAAWDGDPESWLMQGTLQHYFGTLRSLEELVEKGQWLQCEGYTCLFEEARRQKPNASMALNWDFNDCWPTAANNSLVLWGGRPKPAYYAVRAACRPVLASARIPRFSWKSGETFSCELWILNDTHLPLDPATVVAEIEIGRARFELGQWKAPSTPANRHLRGVELQGVLPSCPDAGGQLTLRLRVEGRSGWDSSYVLQYAT